MFVDKVQVSITAGKGGDGAMSFRHEKFVDRGGPDGGDGGHGGNVVIKASRNQNTLTTFRYNKRIVAEDGRPGQKARRHGKNGKSNIVAVPVGTVISDSSGNELADLREDNQEIVIAKGGHGGFGNAHFVSSTRQAPRVAEKGESGDHVEVSFELKMIADVGLVGLPNAGKSTLLSVVSNAKPEIGDYPFTTLHPNLGVVDIDEQTSVLFADIPGLIEGASSGKGLGDEFLRHVERTSLLIHLVDAYQENVVDAYRTIMNELKAYHVDLSKKPQVVILSKIDGMDEAVVKAKLMALKKAVPKNTVLLPVSSKSGQGLSQLLYVVKDKITRVRKRQKRQQDKRHIPVIHHVPNDTEWSVVKTTDGFQVLGLKIERFAARTHFGDVHGEQRLRDIMHKMGITKELERQGIDTGDTVYFGSLDGPRLKY